MSASVLYIAATVLVGTLVYSTVTCDTILQKVSLRHNTKLVDEAIVQYVGSVGSLTKCCMMCRLDASCNCGSYNSQTKMCGKSSTRRIESRNTVTDDSWISFNATEETRNGLRCETDGDCQGADANAICIYRIYNGRIGMCMCDGHFTYNVGTGTCDTDCTLSPNFQDALLIDNKQITGYTLGASRNDLTLEQCWDYCKSKNRVGFSVDYRENINSTCSCNFITYQQCLDSDPGSLSNSTTLRVVSQLCLKFVHN